AVFTNHASTTLGGLLPKGRVIAESFVGRPRPRARCRQPSREIAVPREWELPTMRGAKRSGEALGPLTFSRRESGPLRRSRHRYAVRRHARKPWTSALDSRALLRKRHCARRTDTPRQESPFRQPAPATSTAASAGT